jgi:hypothetical protein
MRCAFCRGFGSVVVPGTDGDTITTCLHCKGSGEAPEGRDTRDDRIRALAGGYMLQDRMTHSCGTLPKAVLREAARVVDELDALPVPKARER